MGVNVSCQYHFLGEREEQEEKNGKTVTFWDITGWISIKRTDESIHEGPRGHTGKSGHHTTGKGTADGDEGIPKEIVWAPPDCPWKQRQIPLAGEWWQEGERNKVTPVWDS